MEPRALGACICDPERAVGELARVEEGGSRPVAVPVTGTEPRAQPRRLGACAAHTDTHGGRGCGAGDRGVAAGPAPV